MRSKSDHIRIEIKEATEGDVRTFIITLAAATNDFQLADFLRQKKKIAPLNHHPKGTIKGAIKSYLSAAEPAISALASKPKRTLRNRTGERDLSDVTLIPVRSLKVPTK